MVGSIDEFATKNGIPKTFIGLILLPIVGNASEHWTSVLVRCLNFHEIGRQVTKEFTHSDGF